MSTIVKLFSAQWSNDLLQINDLRESGSVLFTLKYGTGRFPSVDSSVPDLPVIQIWYSTGQVSLSRSRWKDELTPLTTATSNLASCSRSARSHTSSAECE